MSFGTLYTHKISPRVTAILAIAQANNLKLDIKYADRTDGAAYEELLRINPLGQVPTFVGADGYVLTECIAIALYITSQSDTTILLGSSRRDYFDILKWMSYMNSDFLPTIGGCILPLIGRTPNLRKNSDDCLILMHKNCSLTNEHLKKSKYLIGDKLTLADFFACAMLAGVYMVFHVVETEYPEMTRWFNDVYNVPMYKKVAGDLHKMDLPYPRLPEHEKIGKEAGKLDEVTH